MNNEFIIDINGSEAKIYMQTGFFNHNDLCYPLHKHLFVEMHIFLSGNAVMQCDNKDIILQEGDVLFIPANMLHKYRSFGENSKRISFLLDFNKCCNTPNKLSLPKALLPLICKEIQAYTLTGRDSKLKALLSYICSDVLTSETEKPKIPITSRELIIEDFFTKKYNSNATLDDLARELMLSHKQTEREVKRLTGNTFIEEMSKRKVEAAIMLSQTTSMSLTEISKLVGYTSYCGFYKAYKKYVSHFSKQDSPIT